MLGNFTGAQFPNSSVPIRVTKFSLAPVDRAQKVDIQYTFIGVGKCVKIRRPDSLPFSLWSHFCVAEIVGHLVPFSKFPLFQLPRLLVGVEGSPLYHIIFASSRAFQQHHVFHNPNPNPNHRVHQSPKVGSKPCISPISSLLKPNRGTNWASIQHL